MPQDNMPLISIIVPVYKVEKYLKQCVESILAQTYRNFELILVDDGSPDTCPVLCDEYAKVDPRIIVIHKTNGGLSDARNAGLDVAHGEYIGFVDSDDYIAPEMYEILLRRIIQDGSDIACCNYLQVNEDNIPCNNQELPIKDGCLDRLEAYKLFTKYGGYYGIACNKLYCRKVWKSIRYPLGKKYEDMFVIFLLIEQCQKISHVNASLYYYVRREGSITLETQSTKDFDLGLALIQMRTFAVKNNITCLHEYSANRLSYQIEKWWDLCKNNVNYRDEFAKLCKKGWFLFFDKYAWGSYSWKGKIVARIRLLGSMLNLYERI